MSGGVLLPESEPPSSPIRARIGVIGPLSLVDTTPYEFYRVAAEGAIFIATGLGLTALDAESSRRAFAGLEAALAQLEPRGVDLVMLNGLPMLAYLDEGDMATFRSRAAGMARLGGRTALDACRAAIATLGVGRIAVASKWSDQTNRRFAERLSKPGLQVVGHIGKSQDLEQIKGDYEAGSRMAWELAHQAREAYRDADAILLAGSAWLTLHLIAELERVLGVPVLTGLQCTNWYALNLTSVFEPRPGYGLLFSTPLAGVGGRTP